MKNVVLTGTTIADGSATITSTEAGVTGYVEKIVYDYTDTATSSDFTFTAVEAGVNVPVMTITNAATGDTVWYPRTLANKVTDAAAFANWADKIFVTDSTFKVVIAGGGATKTAKFIVYLSDE